MSNTSLGYIWPASQGFVAPTTAALASAGLKVVNGKSYDYIIVGGGLIPYYTNINVDNYYDITSAPEPFMQNKTWKVHVGNVVGGLNADYNAWEMLGSPGWGFRGLAKYFKKFTHFDGPSEAIRKHFNITYDAGSKYDDHTSIMGSFASRNDIPHSREGFDRPIGTLWTPNSIDNSTKERCYARKAYFDPVKGRSNLHLLTGTRVNELTFHECRRLSVSGVKLTSNNDSTTATVNAIKEVILAAGGVFTPHLLMLSGIGPADVLSAAGIAVKRNLPAVGSNFQNHQALYMRFKLSNQSISNPDMLITTPDPAFNASAAELYVANRTGPWTFGQGNAALFLAFKDFSTKYQSITALITNQNATAYLPIRYSQNKALLKGHLAQPLQKPLSRGTLVLKTTNPSANPIVVRNAFQNPVDKMVLGELYQTDEEIFDASIRAAALDPTYAHSSGWCTLMPEELEGCVDTQLRVYGVANLRVVDGSIIPLIPAAHLQATMYAVAEKAADIVKRVK
ncbi:choline dehydrogenase [Setomelanomma holmii]|uniref:Choline dehydrogenase n=1 Tax=Setomelanomma holmii TaxID=210430 RepID=A0A9P4LF97_9PLEO|nr:choline dehydrogenase [Setomelanomma holmii]